VVVVRGLYIDIINISVLTSSPLDIVTETTELNIFRIDGNGSILAPFIVYFKNVEK
jgi:hypothetical protein